MSSDNDSAASTDVTFPRTYNAATDLVDRHVAEGRGARVAFTDDRESVTYAELAKRANRAGNALISLGMRREERVMMVMHDTIAFPAVFLGAMKAGMVPVPTNTLLQPKDYAHLLGDSRARVLVVSDVLLPKLADAIAANKDVTVLVSTTPLTSAPHAYPTLEDAMAKASDALEAASTTPDEPAFWLYSSGSTGMPKGAIHLHSHIRWTTKLYADGVLGVKEDDVLFSAAKLFFAYGLGNALTFPLMIGARAILVADRPSPQIVARVMSEHAPTIFCGVPTLFAHLLATPEFSAVSQKLRVSISAGEALPKHVGEAWRDRFGSDILDGIGSTEMLHIFLSNRHGDVRYGTSGKPVPGYQLKLSDDSGEPVPDGEEGSLWVKGPSACTSYFCQREKSLATFHGPWTKTGDRYIRDKDGYYTYSGRADDMLKVGGIWVSPFEVESALGAHEAVLEAAVIGSDDKDGLTKPKAFVVLKDAAKDRAGDALANDLKAFVKNTLAAYKYPRWIEFVNELPKTATGKIQRFRLRGR